jgi:predicted amidohydrolase YtcJ
MAPGAVAAGGSDAPIAPIAPIAAIAATASGGRRVGTSSAPDRPGRAPGGTGGKTVTAIATAA